MVRFDKPRGQVTERIEWSAAIAYRIVRLRPKLPGPEVRAVAAAKRRAHGPFASDQP
jgi:hypothetical protein